MPKRTSACPGWVHRLRDHGGLKFIDLRDHYGITQIVVDPDLPAFATAETLHSEWVVQVAGRCRPRPEGTENPELPTGQIEIFASRDSRAVGSGRAAAAGVRRPGISRRHPAALPLPRPAPRAPAPQHHAARRRSSTVAAAAHEGARLLRIPDADPHRLLARRRARLPGAVAASPGQVLRAAAGAAAVQAADHDLGLRPLFPDRALLPRRGRPRRPLARRILPARCRDELRHPGGRLRRDRAGDARGLRGVRRGPAGDARSSRASPTARRCRKYGTDKPDLRNPHRDAGRHRALRGSGFKVFAAHDRRRSQGGGLGHPGARAAAAAPSATG